MHPLVLIPLAACIVCGTYCLAPTPASYDTSNRRRRWLGKALFACPAVWAFCEVGMMLARDAATAERFVPVVAAAALTSGAVGFDLGCSITNPERKTIPRAAVAMYAVAALLIVSTWATGAFLAGVVAVPWGYALEPGPLFPLYVAWIAGCGIYTFRRSRQAAAETLVSDAPPAGRGIALWILALVAVGTLTDAVLPSFGVQVPRLTTAGFAVLAGVVLWSMSRPSGYVFASQAIISREVLRSIHDGVAFVTLDDRVLLANEGMENFLGDHAEQIVGGPFQRHLPDLALDHPQEKIDAECLLHPRVGGPISVAVSVSTARDARGEPLGLVVVVRDLRQIELLRSQLVTSGRLAAVGQLAAGIAHEINNPLAFIRTNLAVLRDHWSELGRALEEGPRRAPAIEALKEGEEIIQESLEGVDRAARIVRDVREFSHAGRPERERIDVNDLIDRVLRISSTQIGVGTRLVRDYHELPEVPAAPQQLEQVFLNLIVNAVQATHDGGTITIRTRHEGDAVVVRVSDDGLGIPPEVAARIFDPFFTTKSVGEGTGLGLSISHQIVHNHGGEIAVEPQASRGACFRVSLPIEATPTPDA